MRIPRSVHKKTYPTNVHSQICTLKTYPTNSQTQICTPLMQNKGKHTPRNHIEHYYPRASHSLSQYFFFSSSSHIQDQCMIVTDIFGVGEKKGVLPREKRKRL